MPSIEMVPESGCISFNKSLAIVVFPLPDSPTTLRIIVADEPVSMIDASLKMNVVNLFKQIKNDYNVSFIYITHDLATAYYISDYIAIMYKGQIVEYGKAKTILDNPYHPYTQLLLESIPTITGKWAKKDKSAISQKDSFSGCKFFHRCSKASNDCSLTPCTQRILKDGRLVLCHKCK